ncbi:hypothetical protein [Fodinicola acaciae]|uniref:hypothetical protein n=1 Tax=Fodinicola acaciae TaxID=2681555 RepID=UPI0013D831E9|nr:hypothetical protein [Fodinicola acaciae]
MLKSRFRPVIGLVAGYVVVSFLALVVAVIWSDNPALVTDAVWIRGGIVAATSLLMLLFTVRAARASKRDFLRLRIVSAVMVVAIAVLVSIPGFLPLWMRLEQGLCGLLLLGVVVLVNRKSMRSEFAS